MNLNYYLFSISNHYIMKCHNLDVQAGWLEQQPEELYDAYVTDTFHIL